MFGFTLPDSFFPLTATIAQVVAAADRTLSLQEIREAIGSIPCGVQQYGPPEPRDDNDRRGSVAKVRIFFRPGDGPGRAALLALLRDDSFNVPGYPNPLILDGPPYAETSISPVLMAEALDYR